MSAPIHVVLAEDKPRLAAALAADLALFDDLKLTGSYPNGADLLSSIKSLPNLPDLIFMDIEMPEMDGIEATRLIKDKHPQIRVLMLTVFEDENNLFQAIQAGADGYLLKGAQPGELYQAVQQALKGGAPMAPLMARKALKLLRAAPAPTASGQGGHSGSQTRHADAKPEDSGYEPLTARETQVLEQLAAGLKYRDIAANLVLSEGTIRKHVENVYRKLRVNNKVSAVEKGKRLGRI